MTGSSIIVGIVTHTPTWVWLVFAYLLYVGIRRTQPRVVTVRRMLILPIIMFLLTASSVFTESATDYQLLLFCLALAVGLILGNRIGVAAGAEPAATTGSIQLPGEWWSLTLLMSAFIVHYTFGVMDGIGIAGGLEAMLWHAGLMGMLGGMFLGRALTIVWSSARGNAASMVAKRD